MKTSNKERKDLDAPMSFGRWGSLNTKGCSLKEVYQGVKKVRRDSGIKFWSKSQHQQIIKEINALCKKAYENAIRKQIARTCKANGWPYPPEWDKL